MAKKAIKPDALYDIKLSKSVKYGQTWLRPGQARVRVKGSVVQELGEAVAEYAEVSK